MSLKPLGKRMQRTFEMVVQEVTGNGVIDSWTVQDWVDYGHPIEDKFLKYPNAVLAKEIFDTPLYKALTESSGDSNED